MKIENNQAEYVQISLWKNRWKTTNFILMVSIQRSFFLFSFLQYDIYNCYTYPHKLYATICYCIGVYWPDWSAEKPARYAVKRVGQNEQVNTHTQRQTDNRSKVSSASSKLTRHISASLQVGRLLSLADAKYTLCLASPWNVPQVLITSLSVDI